MLNRKDVAVNQQIKTLDSSRSYVEALRRLGCKKMPYWVIDNNYQIKELMQKHGIDKSKIRGAVENTLVSFTEDIQIEEDGQTRIVNGLINSLEIIDGEPVNVWKLTYIMAVSASKYSDDGIEEKRQTILF